MRASRRAPAAAVVLACALWPLLAGCVTVEPQANLPAEVPEYRYETPRVVAAAIPPDKAQKVFEDVLRRSRTPLNQALPNGVSADRFSFRWSITTRFDASTGRPSMEGGERAEHAFDLAFADVTAAIIDLRSLGGRVGVKFRKGGQDIPYAWFCTPTLEDAETILDAIAVLGRRRTP